MNIEKEVYRGTLIVTTTDNRLRVEIDINTGETLMDEPEGEVTIDEFYKFFNLSRSAYRKLVQHQAAMDVVKNGRIGKNGNC